MVHTPKRCAHPDLKCIARGGTEKCDVTLCIMDEAYDILLKQFGGRSNELENYLETSVMIGGMFDEHKKDVQSSNV